MAKKPVSYEAKRGYNYKQRYKITVEEYNNIYEKQNGTCAICDTPETLTKDGKLHALAVDHNHETGETKITSRRV